MNIYNYILILILIISIYISTYDNFQTCQIIKCSSSYTLSTPGDKCCSNKDNASSYNNNDCGITSCNIGYTLSNDKSICCSNKDNASSYNTNCNITTCNIGYTLSDDKNTCCKNVVGDNIKTVHNSGSTYDSSCNISTCGYGKKSGNNCCLELSGVSQYDSTCTPSICSPNYLLSKSGNFCCYNNDSNAAEYTNNGTLCAISKCKSNYYLSNGICNLCNAPKFISNDGKFCKDQVVGALTYSDNGDVNTCKKNYVKYDAKTCICSYNYPNDIDGIIKYIVETYNSVNKLKEQISISSIFNAYLQSFGGGKHVYLADIRFSNGFYFIEFKYEQDSSTCEYTRSIGSLWKLFNNTDPNKMYNVIPNEYKYIKINLGSDWGYLDGGSGVYLNKNYIITTNINTYIRWRYVNYHLINENTQKCISISSDGNSLILEDYKQNSTNQIFELFDYESNILYSDPNGKKSFVIKNKSNSKYIYTTKISFNLLLSDKCVRNSFTTSCNNSGIITDYYHWYQE